MLCNVTNICIVLAWSLLPVDTLLVENGSMHRDIVVADQCHAIPLCARDYNVATAAQDVATNTASYEVPPT